MGETRPTIALTGLDSRVHSVGIGSSGKLIVAGGYSSSNAVVAWDLATHQRVRELKHTSPVTALALTPDSDTLVVATQDGRLVFWNLPDGRQLAAIADSETPQRLTISNDGVTLLSGGASTVRVWKTSSREIVQTLKGNNAKVLALALSPDRSRAIIGKGGLSVEVFELATGKLIQTLKPEGHSFNGVEAVAVSHDGALFATGTSGGRVQLWDFRTLTSIQVTLAHTRFMSGSDAVLAMQFHPREPLVASSALDGTIKMWRGPDSTLVDTMAVHSAFSRFLDVEKRISAYSLAFTRDGSTLVSGHDDGIVRLWKVPSPK